MSNTLSPPRIPPPVPSLRMPAETALPFDPRTAENTHQEKALAQFRTFTGSDATHLVLAPGRVNLIGEHTDYNGGFVLPLAIEVGIYLAARERRDRRVRLWSTQVGAKPVEFDLAPPPTPAPGAGDWSAYVRGVLSGLLGEGLPLRGFDALVYASLPAGGGLSSSAALEVATATLGEILTGRTLDPVKKALLCQKAEHVFAGTPCGIMDQFAVIFGQRGHLLLLDCRSLEYRPVPMHGGDVSLLVINTMVKHELTDGGYASRRDDCFAAAKQMGFELLRDATPEALLAAQPELSETHFRRARHVITENARTLAAAEALQRGAWPQLGELMYASHASLRDDFDVSCAELDSVVEIARSLGPEQGVYGCRMTGGGFGGCCVALVETAQSPALALTIHERYRNVTGLEPVIFATQPAAGPAVLLRP